jgi:hypothetical protein
MTLAVLLIFSGFDRDWACAIVLSQVCLATTAKASIFLCTHVFVRAFVRNMSLQWRNRTIFDSFSGKNVR